MTLKSWWNRNSEVLLQQSCCSNLLLRHSSPLLLLSLVKAHLLLTPLQAPMLLSSPSCHAPLFYPSFSAPAFTLLLSSPQTALLCSSPLSKLLSHAQAALFLLISCNVLLNSAFKWGMRIIKGKENLIIKHWQDDTPDNRLKMCQGTINLSLVLLCQEVKCWLDYILNILQTKKWKWLKHMCLDKLDHWWCLMYLWRSVSCLLFVYTHHPS